MLPPPRRIHVRWTEVATSADRARAEQELHLEARESREERTWSYELSDYSAANIARLVAHPLIEDTHNIDRGRLTLAPEVPAVRAWIRRMYQRRLLSTVSARWQTLAPIFGVIGLVLAWSQVRAAHRSDPMRVVLAGILVVSLVLRMVLVLSGGQFYWPDESRYQQARDVVVAFATHDPTAAMKGPDIRMRLLIPARQ